MRVKLAVEVLNSKVQKDMARHATEDTESTKKFIFNFETLWNVFNDTKPLSTVANPRISDLDQDQLTATFINESESASHFISWQTICR